MRDIRRSWHCRRLFFRYLRQRNKEKEAEKQLYQSAQLNSTKPSIQQDNNKSENAKSPNKVSIWAIVVATLLVALIIILITVNAVSCSNKKKITLDEGRVSDYSWSKEAKFYTTAHRETKEGKQTFYVTLSIYGKSAEKVYVLQKAFSFEDFKYMASVEFEIEKWLVTDYQSFGFTIDKNWNYNLDKPQDHHIFKETIAVAPTCLNSGRMKTTCEHCTISKTEIIPALGHNWIGVQCVNCRLKMKTYRLTISESLILNAHVGDSWSKTYKYNNEKVGKTFTVTAPPDSLITISATITEHDDYPDVGHSSIKVVLTDGKTSTGIVTVQENRGQYAGNKAKWNVSILVEEI